MLFKQTFILDYWKYYAYIVFHKNLQMVLELYLFC
jgi:hypothetical protein